MSGRPTASSDAHRERWTRIVYVLILCLALTLLAAVLSARFYSGFLSSALRMLLLLALGAAMGLIGRSLFLARRQQGETAKALHMTERTYKSVFDNALDGILILDDAGRCLEANPAALVLFGTGRDALVGRSIERFFSTDPNFGRAWERFLERTSEHAERRIHRPDGGICVVEYTARANFLPGHHVAVLRDITRKKEAEIALRESEERFQQMAGNIQEIFWMLDAEKMKVLYVSPAYEMMTGRPRPLLSADPSSYEEIVHPEDRARVLSKLNEAIQAGRLDEEFRIVRLDDTIRWIWARAFPVKDSAGRVRRLVGTVQDVTARKCAEEQMARNFDLAEAARAEAEAFRKTSLALTQNLSMDYVLETLLQALRKLVPYESAEVILVEADTRLFLARQCSDHELDGRIPCSPETFDARDSHFLMEVLASRSSMLLSDTTEEPDWAGFNGFSHLRSWLCVPLIASQQLLGVLSLGDTRPHAFTGEHLRLAKSLAIPAAVAIQNARLYEQAEILRAELEERLLDLDRAEQALRQTSQRSPLSS